MTDEDPRQGRIRLGRRRERATESLDAVEMAENALEATEETMGPVDPAVMLVEEQRRLIKAQVSNERMGFVLRCMTALVGVGVVVGLALMVWSAANSRAVVVDAFDSPYGLTRRGQTGQVIARGVSDVIQSIGQDSREAAGQRAVALTWTRDVAVVVPTTGVSLGDVDKLLRTWFGDETHIGGSVTVSTEGVVSLTIRADGVRARTFTGPEAEMPRLITEASEYVYSRFEPVLFAYYLLETQRYEDAAAFLPVAYAGNRAHRAELAKIWGILLTTTGDAQGAVEKLRLSLQSDPLDADVWSLMIGTLFDAEGEEAAHRASLEMAEAYEAADRLSEMDTSNSDLLVQNWTRVAAVARADLEATGGAGAVGGQESGLADAEGRLHAYRTARRVLAGAPPEAPLTVAASAMVSAYEAIAARDAPAALAAMTTADAQWRASEDVRFAFYETPCFLGLARGLSRDWAGADRAFDEGSQWLACAAFRADVLEMRGRPGEADRAYGVAIRMAPSLPFAYHRRGLTLLTRGEWMKAAGRFKQAHERGPRWADPLKGWGDALAAQGRWAEAASKYAEAEPLAPEWRELRLAHAVALERLGRSREARAQRDAAARL